MASGPEAKQNVAKMSANLAVPQLKPGSLWQFPAVAWKMKLAVVGYRFGVLGHPRRWCSEIAAADVEHFKTSGGCHEDSLHPL
jgi:hypothetical protein